MNLLIKDNQSEKQTYLNESQLSYVSIEQFNRMNICLPESGASLGGMPLWQATQKAKDNSHKLS